MYIKRFFQKKILDLINIYGKSKISNFTDGKIESSLRAKVHAVEKELSESEVNFQNMIYARMFYFEARRRNLLSKSEIDWCEGILFGAVRQDAQKFTYQKDNLFRNVLKQRRSVRKWKDVRITKEEFGQLIDAARWAPSSCNRQPWHFLLTQDKNKIEFLSKITNQSFVKNAPSCILILINLEAYDEATKYYFAFLDAGVAIQNMLLMAENMNLGACFVNLAPIKNFELQKEQIKHKFGIPKNFELICVIPIGRSENQPKPPGRKDISGMIHLETF